MTRVIAIASQKGGVGKTTTALNLGAFLHQAGQRTLLVDLDPQANATSGIGAERPPGDLLVDLLSGSTTWQKGLQKTRLANLQVVSCFPDAETVIEIDDVDSARVAVLHDALVNLPALYDFVILDCPPSFGALALLALQLADSVLIPVQCEYYAMEGLSQILPMIERIAGSRQRGLEIEGLLLTMFSEELDLSHEVAKEVRGYFPDKTLQTIIPRDVHLAEASSHGLTVGEYNLRSRASWAYLNLAKEIMSHVTEKAR